MKMQYSLNIQFNVKQKILFSYLFLFGFKFIKGYKFVCVGVKFLAFNVLLHSKSEQKVYMQLILCTNNL